MQTNQNKSLFSVKNASRIFWMLVVACVVVVALIISQIVAMVNKTQSPIQEMMAKQQNNLVIIADQLEIQQEKRSKRNELQANIDLLNVEINASKDIVVQSMTANTEIKDQMIVIANPLPITNSLNDNK
jgi:Na+-transporting NADH:ubiquinone oxidoreductase subunit NqrC